MRPRINYRFLFLTPPRETDVARFFDVAVDFLFDFDVPFRVLFAVYVNRFKSTCLRERNILYQP